MEDVGGEWMIGNCEYCNKKTVWGEDISLHARKEEGKYDAYFKFCNLDCLKQWLEEKG